MSATIKKDLRTMMNKEEEENSIVEIIFKMVKMASKVKMSGPRKKDVIAEIIYENISGITISHIRDLIQFVYDQKIKKKLKKWLSCGK